MSEETNQSGSDSEGIANLRRQYEQLQKDLKARDDELAGFRAEKRQSSVADFLKGKGLDAEKASKAAKLYSGEDTSEDAVGKWFEDYGDVFGAVSPQTQQASENAAAAAQITDFAQTGSAPLAAASIDGKVIGDPVELDRIMRTTPVAKLVEMGWLPESALRSV